jgi:ribonuclease P/MRP protein subunit POP5
VKPRPPTLRGKKRYILARIDPVNADPEPRELYYTILDSLTRLYGDTIAAEANMVLISCESGYAVIRCSRGFEHQVRTALSVITSAAGQAVAVRSLATSGTLLALRSRLARLPRHQAEEIGDLAFSGSVYSARRYQGQKVDLVEKGIKSQELLFLTQDDLEEL